MLRSLRGWGIGVVALLLGLTSTAVPASAQYYGSGYNPYGSYYGSGYNPYGSYYGSGYNPYGSYYGSGYNPYGSYYGNSYSPYSSYYGTNYSYNPYGSSYYNNYNPYGSYYGSSYYNNYNPYNSYYGSSYGYPYNSYYAGYNPYSTYYGNTAYSSYYGNNPYGYNPYGYYPYGYNPYYNNTCTGYANQNGISGCNATAATVSINDGPPGFFSPATVTVRVGQTVTWTNSGPTNSHTATSATNLWNTGVLAPGQSGSYTFTLPGTYSYTCTLHGHTGTVIVTS